MDIVGHFQGEEEEEEEDHHAKRSLSSSLLGGERMGPSPVMGKEMVAVVRPIG